ncbi:MAG: hypothetical protein IPL84_00105 [Chitinophagaceae bacterium]|nr:hypothetical protein [Chitinophagaceae bacterium]
MSDYKPAPEGKDPALWEIAQKRASLKTHALTYLIMNCFLLGSVVLFEQPPRNGFRNVTVGVIFLAGMADDRMGESDWPFSFLPRLPISKTNSVEREYEKLKSKK